MATKKAHRQMVQAWFNLRSEYDTWVLDAIEFIQKKHAEPMTIKQVISLGVEALMERLNSGATLPPPREEVVRLEREERQKIDNLLASVKAIEKMLASGKIVTGDMPETRAFRKAITEYDEEYGTQAISLASRYQPIEVDIEEDE